MEQEEADNQGAVVMFCTYRQRSNSGSYVITDSIKHYVCIEADSEQRAYSHLVGLMVKALWELVCVDDEPMIEYGKGIMPLGEFISSKHNRHRRQAIVYYADGMIKQQ